MENATNQQLTKQRLLSLRESWSKPDEKPGFAWDFDGIHFGLSSWMSYDHELREGLAKFGFTSFDELVNNLSEKLGRKPNVVDMMGGAYFLRNPENTASITGVRVHDKDPEFHGAYAGYDDEESLLYKKIIHAANRRVVEADILSSQGWQRIREANIPMADLLVCRPVGPFDIRHAMANVFDDSEAYRGLYVSLFQRMVELVNRESGILFSEIPDVFNLNEIEPFFSRFDANEGTQSTVFTTTNPDYHFGGHQRRYVVVVF